MIVADVLAGLVRLGVQIEARGGRLRLRPREAVSPGLAERVKVHRGELLDLLNRTDREVRRFTLAAVPRPDGRGWYDPAAARDPAGRAALVCRAGARQPEAVDASVRSDRVPVGWSRERWIAELRRMAIACRDVRPDLAGKYEAEADRLERLAASV